MSTMTKNYVKRMNSRRHTITHEELNHWFLIWGIIGERRQRVALVRHVPIFDKGPGAQL
jgi:hypothetical protein